MQKTVPMSVVMSGFASFLESDLGVAILDKERDVLQQLLRPLVGYNCLQLSVQRAATLGAEARFGHCIKMGYAPSLVSDNRDSVWADYEELPVASDCVDVALLHHVLEFAGEPHQLLREATRTLTASGHLLIAGFNPVSAWPLYQRYYSWKQRVNNPVYAAAAQPKQRVGRRQPPLLRPVRQGRLADWLSVLNYDVLDQRQFFFRPPVNSAAWLRRLQFCERWGETLHAPLGLAYITLARKRTMTASPVMPSWRASLRSARTVRAHSQNLHKNSLQHQTRPGGIEHFLQ